MISMLVRLAEVVRLLTLVPVALLVVLALLALLARIQGSFGSVVQMVNTFLYQERTVKSTRMGPILAFP